MSTPVTRSTAGNAARRAASAPEPHPASRTEPPKAELAQQAPLLVPGEHGLRLEQPRVEGRAHRASIVIAMPCRGRSVTSASGSTGWPGARRARRREQSTATTSWVSSSASSRPTHWRGPPLNGR